MKISIGPTFGIPNRWALHAYYTLNPFAPDGSGRLLLAAADLDAGSGAVYILSPSGEILDSFGKVLLESSFYHTGYWQTWSPNARFVYYQSGSWSKPSITRRELATGQEIILQGDMEGAPPDGEPLLSGLMGMLYAAGYGEGKYQPERAPASFQAREKHGLFEYRFDPPNQNLRLSVAEVLERHPRRDRLHAADREVRERLGASEGLTLMLYCVRWNRDGSRCLFFFGNHNVVRSRGEPRLAYVFTADRELKDIHLAVDISYERRGVHWGWQPDGQHLIGYGPDPDAPAEMCLAEVAYDGTGYRRLSKHNSGGHPVVSPIDPHMAVTDDTRANPGHILFIDTRADQIVQTVDLPRVFGEVEPTGRNPFRVCHHPVFSNDGLSLLVNSLPGRYAVPVLLQLSEAAL
jgi:hypothetical protein